MNFSLSADGTKMSRDELLSLTHCDDCKEGLVPSYKLRKKPKVMPYIDARDFNNQGELLKENKPVIGIEVGVKGTF